MAAGLGGRLRRYYVDSGRRDGLALVRLRPPASRARRAAPPLRCDRSGARGRLRRAPGHGGTHRRHARGHRCRRVHRRSRIVAGAPLRDADDTRWLREGRQTPRVLPRRPAPPRSGIRRPDAARPATFPVDAGWRGAVDPASFSPFADVCANGRADAPCPLALLVGEFVTASSLRRAGSRGRRTGVFHILRLLLRRDPLWRAHFMIPSRILVFDPTAFAARARRGRSVRRLPRPGGRAPRAGAPVRAWSRRRSGPASCAG